MDLKACQRIFEIAQELRSAYAEFEAINGMLGHRLNIEEWEAAAARYNTAVTAILPELSELTPNSEQTLRTVFMPRSGITPLTPRYLELVAQHRSFNDRLWSAHSGMERDPVFTREQLQGRVEGQSPSFG